MKNENLETKQYRFLPSTIERLDRCVRIRSESRDKVLIRILTESMHLPSIKKATKRAENSYRNWKLSEAMQEKMMQAYEYLIACCKDLIREVEAR